MQLPYRVASFLLVSAVGVAAGLYAGDKVGSLKAMSLALGSVIHESSLQGVVLAMGTDDARVEAILEHVSNEERRNAKFGTDDLSMSPEILRADSMFAYARLARITKRQGKDDRSRAFLEKAISLCSSRAWVKSADECTSDKMFEYAARLDRRFEARQAAAGH